MAIIALSYGNSPWYRSFHTSMCVGSFCKQSVWTKGAFACKSVILPHTRPSAGRTVWQFSWQYLWLVFSVSAGGFFIPRDIPFRVNSLSTLAEALADWHRQGRPLPSAKGPVCFADSLHATTVTVTIP